METALKGCLGDRVRASDPPGTQVNAERFFGLSEEAGSECWDLFGLGFELRLKYAVAQSE